MDASDDCATVREALPEVALGIADGEQRAFALDHIAHCPDCRRRLEELSSLSDELIALAPQHEPPPGFENRVLSRLPMPKTKRSVPRRLRRLALAVAVPAAAAATALGLGVAYRPDLNLASQYRAALRNAHGTYFQSARLYTASGKPAGVVFAYQGSPSWIFYTLDGGYGHGVYKEQIGIRSGSTLSLPGGRLVNRSWGLATPVPVRDIALVKLIRQTDGDTLTAKLPVIQR